MKKKLLITIIIAIIFMAIIFVVKIPTKHNSKDVEGYTPIRNDSLASEFTPEILNNKEFGEPLDMLYRAGKDKEGNTYIAYHILWKEEKNNTGGVLPFLNRTLYTGGLKLQQKMYGKCDIEVIEIKLDKDKNIVGVKYETASDYNPKEFSVKHEPIEVNKKLQAPIRFKVVSWNHLFDMVDSKQVQDDKNFNLIKLEPQYFSEADWQKYEMFKETETRVKKNRAHYIYERESVTKVK